MDGFLVDFQFGLRRVDPEILPEYRDHEEGIPGVFALMDLVKGAISGFRQLAEVHDTYILSTASWDNPSSWSDKLLWVREHLGAQKGSATDKRLVLSHNKHLNSGSILIDDRRLNRAEIFAGELLLFDSPPCVETKTWGRFPQTASGS